MPDEAIKVAVRVRPFNDRERGRKAFNIIEMNGNMTGIKDPANLKAEAKRFAFDHSYWSHDGFKEREDGYLETADPKYTDQTVVFQDLGLDVLANAWEGYNCSLFAYGQTGSGKSYSMVGYGANKGIVPIACEELFKQIDGKKGDGREYQVSVSMFEIYCEKVRDLLSSKAPPKGGLKVREHPKKGFYVEDLRVAPVDSYGAIEAKIDEGTRNRTVAATNMNATSSRAHTIVQISFVQKDTKANTTKTSLINLVDLAGSERHSETGSEGDRLKEGIVINQSLSTLGRCIKALHEQQTVKGKGKISVPYRDSALTSLLKNALGGNSKTVMIAALSPADINYEETLSTLRFADRAKSIKTKATVNESATDRMIRELREENLKLQNMIKGGGVAVGAGGVAGGDDNEELDAMRKQLEQNRLEMGQMEQTWQQRLAEEEATKGGGKKGEKAELEGRRKKEAHFWNLNEDPALTDMIVHFVKVGESKIGNKQAQPPADIQLNGLSIEPEHAKLMNKDNKKISVIPLSGAEILINGKPISKETELSHNDRVLLGGNHLYVFSHPNAKKKEQKKQVTYDMAQAEIAQHSGLMGSRGSTSSGKSKEEMILEEELVQLMPQVYRANAMSQELKKGNKFELVLVAPQARGLKSGPTEIFVKSTNLQQDTEFLWDKSKFTNRYYGMQELYQNFIEGYNDWDVPKDRDPFYDPPDTEVLIGSVHVYLQSLAYMVELDEQLPITDFKGQERGQLSVALLPCSPQGKEITGEFVDSPEELVGKNLCFKAKILNAVGLPRKFTTSYCKYKFYLEDKANTTSQVSGSNPNYGHEKLFSFKPVTKQLVNHFKEDALYIELFGKQSGSKGKAELPTYSSATGGDNKKMEEKLSKIQRLIDDALSTGSKQISIKAVQKVMEEGGRVSNGTAKSPRAPKKDNAKKRASRSGRTTKSSSDSGRGRSSSHPRNHSLAP